MCSSSEFFFSTSSVSACTQPAVLGTYKSRLNQYQQQDIICNYSPGSSFIETPRYEGGKEYFHSDVTVTLRETGETIKGSSGVVYPSKKEAREVAAKDVVEQIERLQRAPFPSNPSSSAAASASSKNSKMLLKECYDRKGFSFTPPRYRTAREDRDGFVAEVELPDLPGQWVAGGVRKTKKEAEHDAASKALKKVDQLCIVHEGEDNS